MARIRLLAPVAGHLADGIPAPAVREPVEVPDEVAALWCDGERAEYVEDELDHEAVVEQLHIDAQEYLAAVEAQHAAELDAVHAGAREYLAAVEAQATEQVSATARSARGKKPDPAGE
jgi:hypothetical protein